MEEVWKDIKGYEGKYQVSNLGNVKSLNYMRTGKEKMLRKTKNKDGYLKVNLYSNKCDTRFVHDLVAKTFLEKPKLEINHLDGNKDNNSIDNLEWCTHAENERHSWRILGKKIKRKGKNNKGKNNNRGKIVMQYDLKDNYIRQWKNANEAGKCLGIRSSHISDCCRKTRKKAGGYKWKFRSTL